MVKFMNFEVKEKINFVEFAKNFANFAVKKNKLAIFAVKKKLEWQKYLLVFRVLERHT